VRREQGDQGTLVHRRLNEATELITHQLQPATATDLSILSHSRQSGCSISIMHIEHRVRSEVTTESRTGERTTKSSSNTPVDPTGFEGLELGVLVRVDCPG